MIDICVEVDLDPKGCARPRAMVNPAPSATNPRIFLKTKRGLVPGAVHIYTPDASRRWQRTLALALKPFMPREKIDEPLRVDVNAILARPQRISRKKDPDGLAWCEAKPDRDNIDKNLLDALDAIGKYCRNDSQVCLGTILKTYAPKGARPCLVIRIRSASAFDPNAVAAALGLLPRSCDALDLADGAA